MLREVAACGVVVSAHPDVIAKIGVKEVLYTTRSMEWGSDVDRYVDAEGLRARFPEHLAAGPRVLKPNYGNRSEEHTYELQSLMRTSYAVFCLTKQNTKTRNQFITNDAT